MPTGIKRSHDGAATSTTGKRRHLADAGEHVEETPGYLAGNEEDTVDKEVDESVAEITKCKERQEHKKVEVDEYLAEIVKYKERQEQKHPGKPWDGHVPGKYSVTLEDGRTANVGAWFKDRKCFKRKRLKRGIKEKAYAEQQLDAIGILWELPTTEVDEYIAEILKYKERQEQKHPGKPWDGHVPGKYSVTLEDGSILYVGAWVHNRRQDRKKRRKAGIEEKSLAEERLDAIGLLWEVVNEHTRNMEVEKYIAEILKYKERQELKHPDKPWDGHVYGKHSVILEDGTTLNVGQWVKDRREDRKKRLRAGGIEEKSYAEQRLDSIGILWDFVTARKIEVDEYIDEIIKYKERQEQNHPGKAWDGHVPSKYSVTLEDGTTANVGAWLGHRKRKRKKRLRDGIEKKFEFEERLDEIGILWEVVTERARTIELEKYIVRKLTQLHSATTRKVLKKTTI